MPTPFAAIEARVGTATRLRLANAEASFEGGEAVVPGIFDNLAVRAGVGSVGAMSRSPEFICSTDLLDGDWAEGWPLTVDGSSYRIALRVDDAALGESTLELERAT